MKSKGIKNLRANANKAWDKVVEMEAKVAKAKEELRKAENRLFVLKGTAALAGTMADDAERIAI